MLPWSRIPFSRKKRSVQRGDEELADIAFENRTALVPDYTGLEAWIEAQRAYWRNVATELLSLVATLQESAGEPGSSLATLERWTEVSRDEEPAWQRLIETHLRRKDHLAARHVWDGYLAAIRELDVAPSEAMTRLYERVLGRADIRCPVKPPMRRWVHPVHSFAGA